MLFLSVCLVLFVAGAAIMKYASYDWEDWGIVPVFVGGLGLLFGGLTMPLSRMEAHAHMAAIVALQEPAAAARASNDGIEGAAYRMKVAEANQWIAEQKYYRTTIFKDW